MLYSHLDKNKSPKQNFEDRVDEKSQSMMSEQQKIVYQTPERSYDSIYKYKYFNVVTVNKY